MPQNVEKNNDIFITEFNKGESKYLMFWELGGDESVNANITFHYYRLR